jgi:hypothetical protein
MTHRQAVHERGYAAIDGVLDAAAVSELHAALHELWQGLGCPALYSRADVVLSDRVHVSPVGLTTVGILDPVPGAARILLEPRVLAAFQSLLGPELEVELSAGVVSDSTRPFFFWHNHVGGIDGEDFRKRHDGHVDGVERLACTTYLTPLDDEHGVMLIHPRRVGDPIAPPFHPGSDPWPGAVELRCPAGTTLLLDQTTWHAVTPMRAPGLRAFLSFFVRRRGLPPTVRRDPTLREAFLRQPALGAHYGVAPQRVDS